MIIQDGLPSQTKGITFPNDTSRTLTFGLFGDPDNTSADVVYTIGAEAPNVTFADGSRTLRSSASVPTVGVTVSASVVFKKTSDAPLFQIPVTGRATEVGGGNSVVVHWIVPVLQGAPSGAKRGFVPVAVAEGVRMLAGGDEADEGVPDPLDPTELERARRVLRTLQAAVDAALANGSPALEAVSDAES
jgi:hypothetical protein